MAEHYRGRVVVPSEGPLDAELVLVGESPAYHEEQKGRPFVGEAGRYLDKGLQKCGMSRHECRIINLIPVRAPEDKFKKHDQATVEWGRARFREELAALENPKLIVALGANPFRWLTGIDGGPGSWHGSILRPGHWPLIPRDIFSAVPRDDVELLAPVLSTFHPAAVARQFPWMWLLMDDLRTGIRFLRGRWEPPGAKRWYINRYSELPGFVDRLLEHNHLVAIDSELDPSWIIGLATEDEVHAFVYDQSIRGELNRLLTSPNVLKVAHNWNHDASFFKRVLGIDIEGPYFDTMGGAHLLDPEREKTLSPGISSRFTSYPYHKWMADQNAVVYCGMDAAVSMDSYWPIIDELNREGLLELANHDHKLLRHLLEMQWEGVPVNEPKRLEVEQRLRVVLNEEEGRLTEQARPVIREKLGKFRKPHLFYKVMQCKCCGGGKIARERCWRCAGFEEKPGKAALVELAGPGTEKQKKAELEAQLLAPCQQCNGKGKVAFWKPFNPDSPQQVADLLYRGLGIRPRRYKGSETIRVERLQTVDNPPPLLQQYITTQQARSKFETVARLQPGLDGKLHCVFDPWGTVHGRVASKEGLIDVGTNMQNIPEDGREMIEAPYGWGLMYPDMAQVEARCVAVLGHDEALIEIYRSGGDSHLKCLELVRDTTGWDMNSVSVGPHAGEGRFFMKKCVPLWTEVLTVTGWKPLSDVKVGDKIIGYDPELERCVEDHILQKHYYANAEVVAFGNSRWEVHSTLEHRWAGDRRTTVEGGRTDVAEVFTTGDFLQRGRGFRIRRAAPFNGQGGDVGLEVTNGKLLTEADIIQMSHEQRESFLRGVELGEGTLQGKGNGITVSQDPRSDRADLIRLAYLLNGYYPEQNGYTITPGNAFVTAQRVQLQEVYQAPVACITTGTGFWIMRQGKYMSLTGNSMYAFMYGIRVGFLAGELGVPVELAAEILQVLERTFPGVARYRFKVADDVRRTRRVTSPTGRRRDFRDRIYDVKTKEVDYEYLKEAWSMAPQDMAAYILALGFFEIKERYQWLKPIAHAHDALLILYPIDRREEAAVVAVKSLSREMWGMDFPAEVSLGPNWYVASQKDQWKRENGFEEWIVNV